MYIYSDYVMHAFSNILSHDGYIYYINVYGTDDVCMCTCMWCGNVYKDRVVFLISNKFFTHTTMWIDATNLYHAPRSSTLQFTNYDTQSVYII